MAATTAPSDQSYLPASELDPGGSRVVSVLTFNGLSIMVALRSDGTVVCTHHDLMQASTSTANLPLLPAKVFSTWNVPRTFAITAQVSDTGNTLLVSTASDGEFFSATRLYSIPLPDSSIGEYFMPTLLRTFDVPGQITAESLSIDNNRFAFSYGPKATVVVYEHYGPNSGKRIKFPTSPRGLPHEEVKAMKVLPHLGAILLVKTTYFQRIDIPPRTSDDEWSGNPGILHPFANPVLHASVSGGLPSPDREVNGRDPIAIALAFGANAAGVAHLRVLSLKASDEWSWTADVEPQSIWESVGTLMETEWSLISLSSRGRVLAIGSRLTGEIRFVGPLCGPLPDWADWGPLPDERHPHAARASHKFYAGKSVACVSVDDGTTGLVVVGFESGGLGLWSLTPF